jgi:hypothetical protein
VRTVPKLQVEYDHSSAVPRFATHPSGRPYTGKASGTMDVVDWQGEFVDGRPHGVFRIFWGDRMSSTCSYEHGKVVSETPLTGNAGAP